MALQSRTTPLSEDLSVYQTHTNGSHPDGASLNGSQAGGSVSHVNPYLELQNRVIALEAQTKQQDEKKKTDSSIPDLMTQAKNCFDTVWNADKHQDEKAGRVLTAMSFLTTAATAMFNYARPTVDDIRLARDRANPQLPARYEALSQAMEGPVVDTANKVVAGARVVPADAMYYRAIGRVDAPLAIFFVYIFCVFCGSALYLAAMQPALKLSECFRRRTQDSESRVWSLLYFMAIDGASVQQWRAEWEGYKGAIPDLQDRLYRNFRDEAHVIAGRAMAKVEFMSVGSIFFKAAIVLLMVLAASLTLPVVEVAYGKNDNGNVFGVPTHFLTALSLGLIGIGIVFSVEYLRRRYRTLVDTDATTPGGRPRAYESLTVASGTRADEEGAMVGSSDSSEHRGLIIFWLLLMLVGIAGVVLSLVKL